MKPDISVIVVAHAEGRLIHATVQSVESAIARAHRDGLAIEWLFVLDRPTEDLVKYLHDRQPLRSSVIELNCGDLGLARNAGAQATQGKYISFIDGDDIWGSNWLVAAFEFAKRFENRCVLHPELRVTFEKETFFTRNVDQESAEFCRDSLMEHNYWNPSAFALRQTYLQHPFCALDLENGLGYEDWYWNCETVAAGYVHKVVPETIHGLRYKSWKGSLTVKTVSQNCVLTPNSLFALAYQRQRQVP